MSFLVGGVFLSLALGAIALKLVGGGTIGVILFFSLALSSGLFLSIYVWQTHAKPVVLNVADLIANTQPGS